jgi:hypothetical protein
MGRGAGSDAGDESRDGHDTHRSADDDRDGRVSWPPIAECARSRLLHSAHNGERQQQRATCGAPTYVRLAIAKMPAGTVPTKRSFPGRCSFLPATQRAQAHHNQEVGRRQPRHCSTQRQRSDRDHTIITSTCNHAL